MVGATTVTVTTIGSEWSVLGGWHAGLRFSVLEMQRAVRKNHDGCPAGKGETCLPRLSGPEGGAGLERILRQDNPKELTVGDRWVTWADRLGTMRRKNVESCDSVFRNSDFGIHCELPRKNGE